MLNKIWGVMITIGILYAAFQGKLGEVGNGMLSSAKEAVNLSITMLGIMAFWSGLMNVAKKAGILGGMNRILRPALHFLFPEVPVESDAMNWMGANMVANIMGLGWAATPFGLKAMVELRKLNHDSNMASDAMCTFLVINISSLQLIPINIIAYRNQYGSVNPAAVVGAGILATLISTCVGIIVCKIGGCRPRK